MESLRDTSGSLGRGGGMREVKRTVEITRKYGLETGEGQREAEN